MSSLRSFVLRFHLPSHSAPQRSAFLLRRLPNRPGDSNAADVALKREPAGPRGPAGWPLSGCRGCSGSDFLQLLREVQEVRAVALVAGEELRLERVEVEQAGDRL